MNENTTGYLGPQPSKSRSHSGPRLFVPGWVGEGLLYWRTANSSRQFSRVLANPRVLEEVFYWRGVSGNQEGDMVRTDKWFSRTAKIHLAHIHTRGPGPMNDAGCTTGWRSIITLSEKLHLACPAPHSSLPLCFFSASFVHYAHSLSLKCCSPELIFLLSSRFPTPPGLFHSVLRLQYHLDTHHTRTQGSRWISPWVPVPCAWCLWDRSFGCAVGQQTTSLLHFLPCGKLCSWGPSPSNTPGFPSTCGVCLLHASCCSPLLLVFFGVAQVKCEMEATKLSLFLVPVWCM